MAAPVRHLAASGTEQPALPNQCGGTTSDEPEWWTVDSSFCVRAQSSGDEAMTNVMRCAGRAVSLAACGFVVCITITSNRADHTSERSFWHVDDVNPGMKGT